MQNADAEYGDIIDTLWPEFPARQVHAGFRRRSQKGNLVFWVSTLDWNDDVSLGIGYAWQLEYEVVVHPHTRQILGKTLTFEDSWDY